MADTLAVMADLGRAIPDEIRKVADSPFTTVADTRDRLDRLSKWAQAQTGALAQSFSAQCQGALSEVDLLIASKGTEHTTLGELAESNEIAGQRIDQIHTLAEQCGKFAEAEYGFLFDKTRQLLAIGYNVDASRRDDGYYDLLASEARLCVFVAIAQGQLPQESWFALGRLLTSIGGDDARQLSIDRCFDHNFSDGALVTSEDTEEHVGEAIRVKDTANPGGFVSEFAVLFSITKV